MCRICLLIRRPLASLSPSADCLPTMTSPTCSTNGITAPSHEWLSSALLPKVAQWSVESAKQLAASGEPLGRRRKRESLIPLGRYSQLYAELKEKYGPTLVQVHVYVYMYDYMYMCMCICFVLSRYIHLCVEDLDLRFFIFSYTLVIVC